MENTPDWLVRHAVDNVWQRPHQDMALNIKGCRISERGGAVGHVSDGFQAIPMPGKGFWHVFHMGKLHARGGNLNVPPNVWYKLSACINEFSCFMRVYSANGLTVPTGLVRVRRTAVGAVILAIPDTDRYSWAEKENVFLRIYPGYSGGTTAPTILPTTTTCYQVAKLEERQNIVNDYIAAMARKEGYVSAWVNGKRVKTLTIDSMAAWDDVEIMVDGRVRRFHDFVCGNLKTFSSTLDKMRKYLLHLPKEPNSRWSFANDVELEIFNGADGRYYAQNMHRDVRQLTFNDLSIPTERITQLQDKFDAPVSDLDSLVFRLIIREDFLHLPITYSNARIHDLYRLTDSQIIAALAGANANLLEWQGAKLEEAMVNKLAAARYENITREMATEAYGYNAAGFYCANTPTKLKLDANGWGCTLPQLLAASSTVYEYDGAGLLLGKRYHSNDTQYYAQNPSCRLVEAIAGQAADSVRVVDNAPDFTIREGENVALWIRMIVAEKPTDDYYPAVLGTDYTQSEDNVITWKVDRTRRHPTVIYDDKHLFFESTFVVSEGEIRIPIVARNNQGNVRTLWLEMETVEVWLNQHLLVYGIDYVVSWPEIVVTNKVFINDGTTNKVAVRARGVTGKARVPKTGFVTSGLISNNSRYDVKDDKVIRIVAGGSLMHRGDLVFREDNVVGTNVVADGLPYSIDDPTIPLRTIVEGDTYALRDKARDLDDRVEGYLSNWLPLQPPAEVVPLPHWYHVYSPLLNKVIWDMLNGYLRPVEDDPDYRISSDQLDRLMAPYLDYLKFDPASIGHDHRFVKIHPHCLYKVINLTELQYALVDRVNARLLKGGVQINQYLKIQG